MSFERDLLNASTVLPIVVMALLFGSKFGYFYTMWNGVGSILMVIGLFWAGCTALRSFCFQKWCFFMTVTFVLHILFLVCFQWRALCINFPDEKGIFFPFENHEVCSQWFMPVMYAAAAIFQTLFYLTTRVNTFKLAEWYY